jgi:phage terminase large subunit
LIRSYNLPVKLRPIKASEWLSFNDSHKEALKQVGAVAVNDLLFYIWILVYDILLLFGGRGGGKSEAVCDKLLDECLSQEYFKCYYGRKVFDTVRGSCFATLVECIKKNRLESLFRYSEAENSSMIITCRSNGNSFIPFGSDKADKLKSIKDPTHIWCEEFDQFNFDDFKDLFPTLRTLRGANRFIATFNTHGVQMNHWIIKAFFSDMYDGLDKDEIDVDKLVMDKRIEKIFVNYTDNYFIDQDKYRQTLWLSSAGNAEIFEGIANGAWGVAPNDMPWAFAFSKKKHVGSCKYNPAYPIYLSWDFNRNPMACNVIQWYNNTVYVLEVVKKPKAGVDSMCEYIKVNYPGCLFIVTGDYSGMTETSLFAEQVTHYKLIKHYLNLSEGQIKVQPNPKLAKNSTHVNSILAFYNVVVDADKAKPLIYDFINVKRRADGTILKDDRDDPTQQSDSLDGFRYFCNNFLGWFKPVI